MIDDELQARIKAAAEHYAALSPVDRAIAHFRQRQSHLHAEMKLGLDDGKGVAEEQIAAIPRDPGVILVDEVVRLRGWVDAILLEGVKARAAIDRLLSEAKCNRP